MKHHAHYLATVLTTLALGITIFANAETHTKTVTVDFGNLFQKPKVQTSTDSSTKSTASATATSSTLTKIEGAFGYKLGDELNWKTNKLLHGANQNSDKWTFTYEVHPTTMLVPFTTYECEVTPKTFRIISISATSRQGEFAEDAGEVLALALTKKYGAVKRSDGFDIGFRTLYRANDGSRSVSLTKANDGSTLDICYRDSALQDDAIQETSAIKMAEAEKQKKVMEEKAKSVDATGL